MSPVIYAPLVAAFLYAFAALSLKRASTAGVGPWRVCFVANWIQALIFAPLWLSGGHAFTWLNLWHAVVTGFFFFIGQIFTFLALSRGDVSVVAPVLGTKVVMVAAFTVLLLKQSIPPAWWWASGITVVATVLLGGGSKVKTSELTFRRSLFYGLSAATVYALTDILGQHWASAWGFGHFAPVMFATIAVLSFTLVPFFGGSLWEMPPETWKWLVVGSAILSAQAFAIAYVVMNFGQATLVNILYTSRGIWTISTVWLFGRYFGNTEHSHGSAVLVRRLAGAVLILLAVILAVVK